MSTLKPCRAGKMNALEAYRGPPLPLGDEFSILAAQHTGGGARKWRKEFWFAFNSWCVAFMAMGACALGPWVRPAGC